MRALARNNLRRRVLVLELVLVLVLELERCYCPHPRRIILLNGRRMPLPPLRPNLSLQQ